MLLFATPFWILVASAADPAPRLGFFVVSHEPAVGLRFYDSPQYPKLGYIAEGPDFTVSELKAVSLGAYREHSRHLDSKGNILEQSDEDRPCLEIQLTEQDCKRFETFTTAHRGEQILLMMDSDVLMAPFIRATISTKTVQVSIPKGADADALRRRLRLLVREAK